MAKKVSKWIQEHETMCIKIIRWIVFGVVASILPFLFMLSRYALSDLAGSELDYVLDLLLISIAVSANAVNLLWDDEKKISQPVKMVIIIILVIIMFYFVVTYTVLFEQTIWNSKMLEEYNKLTDSLEKVSMSSINNTDYENIMQRLSSIKLFIDETGPNPHQLKQRRYLSVASLVATMALGVVVECVDDKRHKTAKAKSEGANESNSPQDDDPENLVKKDGE